MREIEVPLPLHSPRAAVEQTVERLCGDMGLRISLRGTHTSHPGSLHWHLKRGDERGTLEITFEPRAPRLWLSVHSNREAGWIDEMLQSLPDLISLELKRTQSTEPAPSGHQDEG